VVAASKGSGRIATVLLVNIVVVFLTSKGSEVPSRHAVIIWHKFLTYISSYYTYFWSNFARLRSASFKFFKKKCSVVPYRGATMSFRVRFFFFGLMDPKVFHPTSIHELVWRFATGCPNTWPLFVRGCNCSVCYVSRERLPICDGAARLWCGVSVRVDELHGAL
jgi:hypothetical protein